MDEKRRILVLGVGNILFTDEGVGVRCMEALQRGYVFSDNVTLMDGGTLGMRLMDPISQCDLLIVCDAVLCGGEPGTIFRLTGDDLRKSVAFRDSMHQTDLVDTLVYCDLIGHKPEAVVIGIEPFDYQSMGVDVSPEIAKRLPEMMRAVLDEVTAAGGSFTPAA